MKPSHELQSRPCRAVLYQYGDHYSIQCYPDVDTPNGPEPIFAGGIMFRMENGKMLDITTDPTEWNKVVADCRLEAPPDGHGLEYPERLRQAARPLMDFLGQNHHPMVKAIVRNNHVEILEGIATESRECDNNSHEPIRSAIPVTPEFLKDLRLAKMADSDRGSRSPVICAVCAERALAACQCAGNSNQSNLT